MLGPPPSPQQPEPFSFCRPLTYFVAAVRDDPVGKARETGDSKPQNNVKQNWRYPVGGDRGCTEKRSNVILILHFAKFPFKTDLQTERLNLSKQEKHLAHPSLTFKYKIF